MDPHPWGQQGKSGVGRRALPGGRRPLTYVGRRSYTCQWENWEGTESWGNSHLITSVFSEEKWDHLWRIKVVAEQVLRKKIKFGGNFDNEKSAQESELNDCIVLSNVPVWKESSLMILNIGDNFNYWMVWILEPYVGNTNIEIDHCRCHWSFIHWWSTS